MKLDAEKLTIDETRSNHMAAAFQYPDCPINEICFCLAVGFGTVLEQCPHLKAESDPPECMYEAENVTKEKP